MVKEKKKDALAAIVLADIFGPQFNVFSSSTALWPLANVPMIDYTLEFLSRTEVDKVTVVSCRDSESVKTHVMENWSGHFEDISVFQAEACESFGDAMRELDARSEVKSDFILLNAGSLCTSDLSEAIQEHRARRQKDKSCVMTMIYSSLGKNHVLRESGSDLFVAYENESKQLLHIREIRERRQWRHLDIPKNLLGKPNILMRGDLYDSGMSICSAQIPPLFSDNFDFETRRSVVKDIFDNEEILGFKCHAHILPWNDFGATAADFPQFLRFSNLTVERWTAPLVPDSLSAKKRTPYRICGNFCYLPREFRGKNNSPIIDRSATLRKTIVGPGAVIGKGSRIISSSIGSNCTIGDNVTLINCIVWSGAKIGNGAQCEQAIVGNMVEVGPDTKIPPRSVICSNVKLGREAKLSVGTFVSKETPPEFELEDNFTIAPSSSIGLSDESVSWLRNSGDTIWLPAKKPPPIGRDGHVELDILTPSNSEDEEEVVKVEQKAAASAAVPEDAEATLQDRHLAFYKELYDCLMRAEEEHFKVENLIAEVNPLRMAYPDVTLEDLNGFLSQATLELSCSGGKKISGEALFQRFKTLFNRLQPLLVRYIKPDSQDAQLDCLVAIEEFALKNEGFLEILQKVFYLLYDSDFLSEEAILQWFSDLEDSDTAPIKEKIQRFVTWLEEADEDESD